MNGYLLQVTGTWLEEGAMLFKQYYPDLEELALSLTNISDSVLHLQEEIINIGKKDTGKERSFGYVQYPLISLNGLEI